MNTQNLQPPDDNNTDQIPLSLPSISHQKVPRYKVARPSSHHTQYNIRASDFTSNLEFTIFPKDVVNGKSLINIRPDKHNITPQKINIEILSPPSGGQAHPKRNPERPSETKAPSNPKHEALEAILSEEKDTRLYKFWPGNNRFFLNGHLMTGPKSDRFSNTVTWVIILVFSIIFFALAFRFLLEDITFLLPLISIYLFVSTVTFFLLTSFTDPGIIPRKAIWELNGEVPYPFNGGGGVRRKITEHTHTGSPSHSDRLETSRGRFVFKGETFTLCTICNIYRPPKTNHCSFCGNCVEVHGHHSHLLNNCIGKRNYRFFVGFLMSVILLGFCYTTSFLIILVTAVGSEDDPSTIFQNQTVTIIVIIIFGVPVLIMIGAILFLCCLKCGTSAKQIITHGKLDTADTLSGEEEPKQNKVDWVQSRSSYIKKRQVVTQNQLNKYYKQVVQEKHG